MLFLVTVLVTAGWAEAQLPAATIDALVAKSKLNQVTTFDPLPPDAFGAPGPLFRDISTKLDPPFLWKDAVPQTLVVKPPVGPVDPNTGYVLGGSPGAAGGQFQSAAPDGRSYGLFPGLIERTLAKGSAGRVLNAVFGGGVCIADFNGDGKLDIYLTNGRLEPPGPAAPGDTFSEPLSGRGLPNNALYVNRGNDANGDPIFEEVAAAVGAKGNGYYGLGCVAADYDNDGRTDLYILNAGPNQLLRNEGNDERGRPRFRDVTMEASLPGRDGRDLRAIARGPNGLSQGISVTPSGNWVDVDGDGCLDLVVITHSVGPFILTFDASRGVSPAGLPAPFGARSTDLGGGYPAEQAHPTTNPLSYWTTGESFLFRQNKRDGRCAGTFTNIAPDVDFLQVPRPVSLTQGDDSTRRPLLPFVATWTDFNGDGAPDVWIANDFGPVQYLRNELKTKGKFVDATKELVEPGDPSSGSNLTGEWMAVALGDIDNDGQFDIFSTNVGPTFFEERIRFGFVEPNDWSPHALFLNRFRQQGTLTNISMLTGIRPQLGVAAASPAGVEQARRLNEVDNEAVLFITGAGPNGGPVGNGGPAVQDDGGGLRPAGALSVADSRLRLKCSQKAPETGCTEATPWIVDQTSIAAVGGFGWGAQFLDYDNDGHIDLLQVGNDLYFQWGAGLGAPVAFNDLAVFLFGFPDVNVADAGMNPLVMNPYFEDGNIGHGFIYRNTGVKNSAGVPMFVRIPVRQMGFFNLADGRGMAVGDLNGDGFLDVVINNVQSISVHPDLVSVDDILKPGRDGSRPSDFRLPLPWEQDVNGVLGRVLINNATSNNNWLAVRAMGGMRDKAPREDGRLSNRDGIGSLVTVESSAGSQIREIRSGEGYQASNPPIANFGVGKDRTVKVTVKFPSGKTKTVVTRVNRLITVHEGERGEAEPAD